MPLLKLPTVWSKNKGNRKQKVEISNFLLFIWKEKNRKDEKLGRKFSSRAHKYFRLNLGGKHLEEK